ncbi:MAG: hypothetical protein R3B57_09420 [Phycisphaerales bacterium]
MSRARLPRLKDLHPFARLGVTLLVLTLVGGYVVAGLHLRWHYDNRDERAGFSLDDIRAAYHGITSESLLLAALKRGHPDALDEADRKALTDWLASDRINTDYDNFDLGDQAPSEIIATSCLDCHSRSATGAEAYSTLPLDKADDVLSIAYSRDVQPSPTKIVAVSQHTHAPTMALVLLVVGALGVMTRWWGWLSGLVLAIGGGGLLADMGGQWLARTNEAWVYAIVVGGFAYAGSVMLMGLAVIVDLWLPGGRSRVSDS